MSKRSSSQLFVFDLDGTCIDTRALVRESYAVVGIEYPDDAWGKTAEEWLPALVPDPEKRRALHAKKNQVYLRSFIIWPPPILAPASVAQRLHDVGNDVRFLTGASQLTAHLMIRRLEVKAYRLIGHSANASAKYAVLDHYRRYGLVTYVDDNVIEMPPNVSFVHWTGQPEDQLMKEVAPWIP